MTLPILAILFGLILLVWSADRFIEGSANVAKHLGMPPLLIGMVIVGFGTSAPELVVSAFAAMKGATGIALGNGLGSNITNITLILGCTALIQPIVVESKIVRRELPLLLAVTAFLSYLVMDHELTRADGLILLVLLGLLIFWTIQQGIRNRDALSSEVEAEIRQHSMSLGRASFWAIMGLILLVLSSRFLVWGATEIALALGVSELIIGLTVVAVGTSLPELAASIVAARKGEDDIAIGNIIGSNLFNSLGVIGLSGVIHPFTLPPDAISRDLLAMMIATIFLFIFSYGFRAQGRINRVEGSILLLLYISYVTYLVQQTLAA